MRHVLSKDGNVFAVPEKSADLDEAFTVKGDIDDLGEYAWKKLGIPAVSLETSYFECGGKVMSEDDYRSIGRILAEQMVNAVLSASVNR